jgi:hypothetical protein
MVARLLQSYSCSETSDTSTNDDDSEASFRSQVKGPGVVIVVHGGQWWCCGSQIVL